MDESGVQESGAKNELGYEHTLWICNARGFDMSHMKTALVPTISLTLSDGSDGHPAIDCHIHDVKLRSKICDDAQLVNVTIDSNDVLKDGEEVHLTVPPQRTNSDTSIIEEVESEFSYVFTLMYGRYTKDLGNYAKSEALRVKKLEKLKRKEDKIIEGLQKYRSGVCAKCCASLAVCWRFTFARLGEDWIFLAILGILMALLSFAMDYAIAACQKARIWLYRDLLQHHALQFLAWTMFPVILIIFSSGFVHIVAPQAIGSGIPEMKTILRGVVLKEYLTFRTLISKMIGLTTSLGSGMPLGKEGPFVHIASIVAMLLSKLVTSFKGIYENESRNSEMLAAACAVGVACSFAAPIGGVLFSIEVTSVYFAVRNYWRGFFAAVCGAMVFRLLAVWFKDEETITALFKTNFRVDFPFDPQELIAFALIGVFCGFAGSLFVWCHRQVVNFNRKQKKLNFFLQKNRFIYPSIVAFSISALTFPLGLGQFMAAELTTHTAVNELFSNTTWTGANPDVDESIIINHWKTNGSNIYVNLCVFIIMNFLLTIIAMTLPVPSGVFIPVFKIGAAFGRLFGECMAAWFPEGIRVGGGITKIIPGGYAVVGAAALSGSVTHTISTSVIVFELTGQIAHIIPVMIAVLISNAIAQSLQPSIYESIILIKKLPYLPDIVSTSTGTYSIYVEDIMVKKVCYIWYGAMYMDLKKLLKSARTLSSFPLVDSPDSMILLGSIQRVELLHLLEQQIGKRRRLEFAAKRAEEQKDEEPEDDDVGTPDISNFDPSRRPSRFNVTKVPEVSIQVTNLDDSNNKNDGNKDPSTSTPSATPIVTPKKSILKKTGYSSSPFTSPNNTVTSQDSRLRLAFENIFRKANTLRDVDDTVQSTVQSISSLKRVTLPRERVIDLSPEEQSEWEEEELQSIIDFTDCHVDPAPFQLVERTSLLKVHSLFSMLGLNRAYVTAIGRLVGVVALKEVRKAIEGAHGSFVSDVRVEPTMNHSASTDSLSNNASGVTLTTYNDSSPCKDDGEDRIQIRKKNTTDESDIIDLSRL